MALFGLIRTKKDKERERLEQQSREVEENKKKSEEVGNRLYTGLRSAASQNKVYNIFPDGTVAQGMGPLVVGVIKNNGLNFSVIVSIKDKESIAVNCHLVQVDINMGSKGKEIHVFYAPNGPDRDYSAGSYNRVENDLAEYVRKYKLFG